ncbi:hypothetical protein C7B82_30790 [Stenomitos frigidus ULC18]|uniref:Uncharacterized protein n=1 Tax=Stenomitos frigidus ULC18 TaxID=2107698 RepID=A0A2T1DTF7_9CYAN|nr:hypothetical protein C7B82_30790 [Stenomitos frigidus ULC18]
MSYQRSAISYQQSAISYQLSAIGSKQSDFWVQLSLDAQAPMLVENPTICVTTVCVTTVLIRH